MDRICIGCVSYQRWGVTRKTSEFWWFFSYLPSAVDVRPHVTVGIFSCYAKTFNVYIYEGKFVNQVLGNYKRPAHLYPAKEWSNTVPVHWNDILRMWGIAFGWCYSISSRWQKCQAHLIHTRWNFNRYICSKFKHIQSVVKKLSTTWTNKRLKLPANHLLIYMRVMIAWLAHNSECLHWPVPIVL